MYVINTEGQKVPIKIWLEKGKIEDSALQQAIAAASHPAVFHHVALMSDTHAGMGVPIGCVFPTRGVVIPNAVGVDIGCGVYSSRLTNEKYRPRKSKLEKVLHRVKKAVPTGFQHNDSLDLPELTDPGVSYLREKLTADIPKTSPKEISNQLGTLGGGNHFIELQLDEHFRLWLMIHSGSRNVGLQTANYFHKLAFRLNRKWHSALPADNLAFLPLGTPEGDDYMLWMEMCLRFAKANRAIIAERVLDVVHKTLDISGVLESFDVHHNYARLESHFGSNVVVHRKGATFAGEKTLGAIPGSMGASSYIVNGLGNQDSFCSCSHGAGRKMSRKKAKEKISMERFKTSMGQVVYAHKKALLDEAPDAYKSIETVMTDQVDLVTSLHILKPILSIKGDQG